MISALAKARPDPSHSLCSRTVFAYGAHFDIYPEMVYLVIIIYR